MRSLDIRPLFVPIFLAVAIAPPARAGDSPEAKALAYLAREVPRWSAEHRCYSCHNNGDAARALYLAIKLGRNVPTDATSDTDRWLDRPEGWDRNGGDGPFSDKGLARLQFASALASAVAAGRVKGGDALARASDRLAIDQGEDGSWPVDEGGRVGSPATYGRPLATWSALGVLRAADPARFRGRIDRAEAWLRRVEPLNSVDASAVLLALRRGDDRLGPALALLRRGQAREGGWGPFADSPPEAFDTAIALLALARHGDQAGVIEMIAKGRAYLIDIQQEDGSWAETTRPAGAESYAQRLSTTGWATMALLTPTVP